MNPINLARDFTDVLVTNIDRELNEELNFYSKRLGKDVELTILNDDSRTIDPPTYIINDNVNEVGKVHIGLVYIVEIADDIQVSVKETDTLEGGFMDTRIAIKEIDRFEEWSKILLNVL
jgi:predicted NUDIX family phosphoesterase